MIEPIAGSPMCIAFRMNLQQRVKKFGSVTLVWEGDLPRLFHVPILQRYRRVLDGEDLVVGALLHPQLLASGSSRGREAYVGKQQLGTWLVKNTILY